MKKYLGETKKNHNKIKQFMIPEFLSHLLLYNIYDTSSNLKKITESEPVPIFLGHGTEVCCKKKKVESCLEKPFR